MKLAVLALIATFCSPPVKSSESTIDYDEYIASPIDLTDQNFDSSIRSNNYFVMFYWPSHQVESTINDTMYDLSELFNSEDVSELKIARIDCDINIVICGRIRNPKFRRPIFKLFKITQKRPISFEYSSSSYLYYFIEFLNTQLNLTTIKNLESNENVVVLTDQNFSELTGNGSWFINFQSSACIHSKGIDPAFDKFASRFGQNDMVKIGKVDCHKNEKACERIRASPLFLWMENGKIIEKYRNNRTDEQHRENRTVKFFGDYVERKLKEKINKRN